MFLKEEKRTHLSKEISRLGNTFLKKRHRTIYHFQCDACTKTFERVKGSTHKYSITKTKTHFCGTCADRKVTAKRMRKLKYEQCRKRVGKHRIGRDGYPEIYVGPDYKFHTTRKHLKGYYWESEHVYIVQEHLDRALSSGEVVHHLDGDKTNNRLDNLVVLSVQEHNNCHAKAEQVVFEMYKQGLVQFNLQTKLYELSTVDR